MTTKRDNWSEPNLTILPISWQVYSGATEVFFLETLCLSFGRLGL